MKFKIATTVYYIISILLFPVSLLGYVIWGARVFSPGTRRVCRRQPRVALRTLGDAQSGHQTRRAGESPDAAAAGRSPGCQSHGELPHTTEAIEANALYWRYGRAATRAAGEPFKFGIDSTPPTRERLSELLRSCGLALREQRTLGRETQKERAWGGFAVASVE